MNDDSSYLRRQLKTAWLLTDLHLTGLDTDECFWRPAAKGMHVHRAADATWRRPFRDRPFGDVVAWVNVELTKNASEIGYARFLYAVRP